MKARLKSNSITIDPQDLSTFYPPPRQNGLDNKEMLTGVKIPVYNAEGDYLYDTVVSTPASPPLAPPRTFDLTKGKDFEFKIIGRKTDGEAPGLMLKLQDEKKEGASTIGMLKFAKYLFVEVTSFSRLVKKLVPANHEVIWEEYIGLMIFRRLGLNTTAVEFARVIASIDQLKNTPKTGDLPEYKGKLIAKAPEEFLVLKIDFSPKATKLIESHVVAGHDEKQNQGHLRPICEGINCNQILGKDFANFNIGTFFTNDPDTMGKAFNNKMLEGSELFVFDSAICAEEKITIRRDGHFYSEIYKNRQKAEGNDRHNSFRNLSMTDDVSFMEMLQAVNNFFLSGTDKLMIADLDEVYNTLQSSSFRHQNKCLTSINNHRSILEGRIQHLKTTFGPYMELYRKDKPLLTALVALEQYLSTSSAYAEEGIPLRKPYIPYEKHFFSANIVTQQGKEIFINLAKHNFEAFVEKITKIAPLGVKFNINKPNISLSVDDFKKTFTPNRVILFTHPETVPLKTALTELKDIDYLENFDALTKALPNQTLAINLSKLNHFLQSESMNPEKYLNILEKMFASIDKELPKDLLTTRQIDHTKGWGQLIELKSKIVKQQQLVLCSLLSEHKSLDKILNGKSILDLFANADLLDISHSVNKLLFKAPHIPDLLQNNAFKAVITAIMSIQTPVNNFKDFRELAHNIHKNIHKILSTLELSNSTKLPAKKPGLGVTPAPTPAIDNLTSVVGALINGGQNIFPVGGTTAASSTTTPAAITSTSGFAAS